jgi:hypothetical protein
MSQIKYAPRGPSTSSKMFQFVGGGSKKKIKWSISSKGENETNEKPELGLLYVDT